MNNIDGWKNRRRLLYTTSLFYMCVIAYCVFREKDTELARTCCEFAFLTLSGNVGYYVFGSSWESIGMARQGLLKPDGGYGPTPPPPPPCQPAPAAGGN